MRFKFAILILVLLSGNLHSQVSQPGFELIRIEPSPSNGFNYAYYLYIPDSLKNSIPLSQKITLLVTPNNTGSVNDTLAVHDTVARKQLVRIWSRFANKLNTVALMPVFPRTVSSQLVYTHALDRDIMLSTDNDLKRLDLQLIAMIADADKLLRKKQINIGKKIWITGFSASGMFSNRFAILHPDITKAVASGSPGGWPIAPVATYNNKDLRYPIGINDLKQISGRSFNLKRAQKIPMFIYMGSIDDNDSVIYPDSYDTEDRDLVIDLFGKTPIDRWPLIKEIYAQQHMNATFKLYEGIKHTINNEMIADVVAFFKASEKN